MEELIYDPSVYRVFSAGNGEVEVYEFAVPGTWAGRTLGELLPPDQCAVVALTRAGRATLPDGDTRLEAGDLIDISATLEGADALRKQLAKPKEA